MVLIPYTAIIAKIKNRTVKIPARNAILLLKIIHLALMLLLTQKSRETRANEP
jgi:hypothetical protein